MANNVQTIPIKLDRQRNIKIDLNTFADLEEVYGSKDEAVDAIQSGSFKAIRTFLWLCLVHEDEALTERDVGAMMTPDNIMEVTKTIQNAVSKL